MVDTAGEFEVTRGPDGKLRCTCPAYADRLARYAVGFCVHIARAFMGQVAPLPWTDDIRP